MEKKKDNPRMDYQIGPVDPRDLRPPGAPKAPGRMYISSIDGLSCRWDYVSLRIRTVARSQPKWTQHRRGDLLRRCSIPPVNFDRLSECIWKSTEAVVEALFVCFNFSSIFIYCSRSRMVVYPRAGNSELWLSTERNKMHLSPLACCLSSSCTSCACVVL